MSKKIAVILSGCGHRDGGEIHESVLTLLAIVKAGATPICYAPNKNQTTVTDHFTGDSSGESRNVLTEAARIARGKIEDLKNLTVDKADALIIPGGFGAALNLCNFAEKGPDCDVDPQAKRVIEEFYAAKKPIGAICIAPALIARVLGSHGIELTIGTDEGTAGALEKLGAKHINKSVQETHVDAGNKIVTTPAYMLAQNIAEVETGISKLVSQVLEMA